MRVREILNLHSTTLCIVPEQCDIDHANQGPPVHIHTSATQDNSRQCWVLKSGPEKAGLSESARGNTHRQDRKTRCCPWLADAAAMISQEFTQGGSSAFSVRHGQSHVSITHGNNGRVLGLSMTCQHGQVL